MCVDCGRRATAAVDGRVLLVEIHLYKSVEGV